MKYIYWYLCAAIKISYFPVYVLSWLLHKFARLLLAISYFGMLQSRIAKDIINNLFNWHGKY